MICERCNSNDWTRLDGQVLTSCPPKITLVCNQCGYRLSKDIVPGGGLDRFCGFGPITEIPGSRIEADYILTQDPEPDRDPAQVVLDLVHDIPGAEIVLERERYVIRLPR